MAEHERRRAPRYRTVRRIVHFGWWDGPTYQRKYAHIQDLSRDGALVTCKFSPPVAGTEVWVTLACHTPEPWHRSSVVGSSSFAVDCWEARLAFTEPFPDYQFDSALTGSLSHRPARSHLEPPPRPQEEASPGAR